jgi:hypothetical protein
MFGNNNMLCKYWDKLLEAYLIGNYLSEDPLSVTKQDVEKYLIQIRTARKIKLKTPGLGSQYKFSTDSGKGTVFTYKSSLIHLAFFTKKVR